MNKQTPAWQAALADAFSSVDELCAYLQLDPNGLPILANYKAFPIRVPRGFAARMQFGDPDDPLLRQVLPVADELTTYPGYSEDPVGDLTAVAVPGIIQKYHGRVLLISTGGCAVHCRYCFRRNFPYSEQQLTGQSLQPALAYIQNHADISEVILSGGDPLLLSDDKLENLLGALGAIAHVQRIRIHTRIPVVLPERMTDQLLSNLARLPQTCVIVIHANHANELDVDVAHSCQALRATGITVLNQSVLLQGVNDNANALCQLSEKLMTCGVLPYYLHLLDKAQGVGHFNVPESHAKQLLAEMQKRLPGYLVPRLVKEQTGAAHKLYV